MCQIINLSEGNACLKVISAGWELKLSIINMFFIIFTFFLYVGEFLVWLVYNTDKTSNVRHCWNVSTGSWKSTASGCRNGDLRNWTQKKSDFVFSKLKIACLDKLIKKNLSSVYFVFLNIYNRIFCLTIYYISSNRVFRLKIYFIISLNGGLMLEKAETRTHRKVMALLCMSI